MPSTYEGFGIAYLEAMAFGLPALASAAGGAREIVTDGVDGFLVRPGDARAIGLRIQELIDHRDRLAEMGLNARKTFLGRPGWDQSLSGVYDFLHGLV